MKHLLDQLNELKRISRLLDQQNVLKRVNRLLKENIPKYNKLIQDENRIRKLAFDLSISPLTGLFEVINLISLSNELLNIEKETGKGTKSMRIYAGETIWVFLRDVIYYIRWLRVAPLSTDEESQAFDLIMTFLSMPVGYIDRTRAIGQAICFLLEKQLRWNPEQMTQLKKYLNSDSLRQIIEGHYSNRLDLLHEESLQLIDQVMKQQHSSLNEKPLMIPFNHVFFFRGNGASIGWTRNFSVCQRIANLCCYGSLLERRDRK